MLTRASPCYIFARTRARAHTHLLWRLGETATRDEVRWSGEPARSDLALELHQVPAPPAGARR
jgi:hypothetical protein